MSGKIEDVVKRLRERAEARRRSGKLLQIDDRMFDLIADEIEEATCDKSSQVGNAAAMFKALKQIDRIVWDKRRHTKEEVEAHRLATEALTRPPRNCDVMSLESAKKLWFAKEILPRLDGDLPLGKEIPFDEWFVSQLEQ
jgi:hypothetical protein